MTDLLECTHDWAVSVHGGHAVDVIYIDFSRAFDSVVHTKLIHKLSNFGISGDLLQWIEAPDNNVLLSNTCFSTFLPVLSGVAHGSVIAPLLFILYVDDICSICVGSNITHKQFSDDLKLYRPSNIYTTRQWQRSCPGCS